MTYQEAINHSCGMHCDGQDGMTSHCYRERQKIITDHYIAVAGRKGVVLIDQYIMGFRDAYDLRLPTRNLAGDYAVGYRDGQKATDNRKVALSLKVEEDDPQTRRFKLLELDDTPIPTVAESQQILTPRKDYRMIDGDPLADAIWAWWKEVGYPAGQTAGTVASCCRLAEYLRSKGLVKP